MWDRLRGPLLQLATNGAVNELSVANSVTSFGMDGINVGSSRPNVSGYTYINHFFVRAPGVFDVVCYTTPAQTVPIVVPHNLGVIPEMTITKRRSGTGNFRTVTNGTGGALNSATVGWGNSLYPVAAQSVTIGANDNDYNAAGSTYVMYLFASKAGISKVGSYTGTATTNAIDCGFTTGARFVLIKRTDSTGDWYVWDTARGIIAGNDPYLLLNSTAAETTSTDYIDPSTAGFELSSTAPAAINASGGTFIYLAFA